MFHYQSYLKSILFCCISTLLVLSVLEIVSRGILYNRYGTTLPQTYIRPLPPKNKDTFRIFAYGGSTVQGNPERYDYHPVELWGPTDFVAKGIEENNRIVREIAHEEDVPLIDQNAWVGKNGFFFGDVCHFSNPGVDRFILAIVSFIKNDLQK